MTLAETLALRLSKAGRATETAAPGADAADGHFRKILDALPAAIYATDAEGRITYFNEAAVALWGNRPVLGISEWSGAWKLLWPDGRPLPHDESPMAIALKERRAVRGVQAIAERPDGTRVPFAPYPTPLFDEGGTLVGAVNLLVDITDRKQTEEFEQRLASIVQFSDDAIISKNLDGVIESWNAGAERIFGYTACEAIGRSIEMLIPDDRLSEEPEILERIRRGERIDHYETRRRRKDGSLIDISLTVSPVVNADGVIIGASKIARDITERHRAQEQKDLLLSEMNHRIKNLFSLASGVVALSARNAATPEELAAAVRQRLNALAHAHALTLPRSSEGAVQAERATTLQSLIREIALPYEEGASSQIAISGPDIAISTRLTTDFALLLHEFTTNAAKYGALSMPEGRIDITCAEADGRYALTWTERGGPRIDKPPDSEGFGSQLARATITRALGGELSRDWNPDGLTIRLTVARDRLAD